MKTANVKVRVKDVKAGVTLYTAHPVYGIDKAFVVSRPYFDKGVKSLFIRLKVESSFSSTGYYETTKSLRDMGVTHGNSYNGRRTFFKLKHAEAWAKKWATHPSFIQQQADHEEWCTTLRDDMEDSYDY